MPHCSDPRNSDTNLGGFIMSKLTKQDKIHIFEEWTLEDKRGTYLSKKIWSKYSQYKLFSKLN